MKKQILFQFSGCMHCPFYSARFMNCPAKCKLTDRGVSDNTIDSYCPLDNFMNCVNKGRLTVYTVEKLAAALGDFLLYAMDDKKED